jgi:hypothetical protein
MCMYRSEILKVLLIMKITFLIEIKMDGLNWNFKKAKLV